MGGTKTMMKYYVRKRDGKITTYSQEKIFKAIKSAVESVGGRDFKTVGDLANEVEIRLLEQLEYAGTDTADVEQIQDIIESTLIKNKHDSVAKEFITYRQQRTREREKNNHLYTAVNELMNIDSSDSDSKRSNANINGDTAMGSMLQVGAETKNYMVDNFILPCEMSEAHTDGYIHIHDKDFFDFTTTCCQINLHKLFKDGFNTGHGHLREPNSIISAAALACIAIQSNQNDQHGGQSVPCFDYYMAEYVNKSFKKRFKENFEKFIEFNEKFSGMVKDINKVFDELNVDYENTNNEKILEWEAGMTETLCADDNSRVEVGSMIYTVTSIAISDVKKDTHQAMEALVANLNSMHSRAGSQVPFSSLNYGTDTSMAGRLVIDQLLTALDEGLGNGETPLFPIHIFKCKKGVNFEEGDPNYDLFIKACKVSAKRMFPNFSFIDSPFNLQYYKEGDPDSEVAYMGCRTRVMGNVYDKTREIATSRGNLSFTSINLPRLAIEAKGDINKFYESLDKYMDLTINELLFRFDIQCKKHVYNFPFLMEQGVWIDSENLKLTDTLETVLKHGTMSIGFIGLAETLVALTGKHHGESEESQKLGLEIIKHMRDRVDRESAERGLNFTLLATPAEGLSGRFTRLDKAKYGKIPGVTDREYYTNSFHVPVYYKCTASHKIDTEAPYHALTNAGHISYIEMDGDPTKNVDAFIKIVKYMGKKGVGYGSINHPIDRDPVCGYTGIINDVCPKCGRHETANDPFYRLRRVTGYLVGDVRSFNNAKRAEEKDRLKHM